MFKNIFSKLFKKNSNIIKIDKGINKILNINGKNNLIDITCGKNHHPKNIRIHINGDNNKVIIKNMVSACLFIEIGNVAPCNNVIVEILDRFVCAQAAIWAYQSNTPIKIGKNCLFSKDIVIRSGELPHRIFDSNTLEDLDKSDGVFIGNHVWIGEHCYIMKKAKIADNSIVGSMSVVTKKFDEQNVVIAGNPAKICKRNISWE